MMSLRFIAAIFVALQVQPSLVLAQDAETVVVWVHGLFNFGGPDQAFPYKSEFAKRGFTNLIADIGPISSNWDRACELFAQIKGTKVDYGVCHSREHGHDRFGKDFTGRGLYPQWDESNRIHFVGHSLGGMTVRQLEIMLQEGSGCDEDESEFLVGSNRNWVRSITTMSTPHDGTSLVRQLGDRIMDELKNIIIGFSGAEDDSFFDNYDIGLDHWGVIREPNESFDDYFDRLVAAKVIAMNNEDLAHYALSEVGAQDLNRLGQQTYSNTFYFAFANERTKVERKCRFWVFNCDDYEIAEPQMGESLHLPAQIIGGSHFISGNTKEEFRKSDGAVNWENMKCPTTNNGATKSNCIEFAGSWNPSTWYWVDIPFFDHTQITALNTANDINNYEFSSKKIHVEHATRLASTMPGFPGFKTVASSSRGFNGATLVDMSDLNSPDTDDGISPEGEAAIFFFGIAAGIGLLGFTFRKIHNRRKKLNRDSENENEKRDASAVTHFDL